MATLASGTVVEVAGLKARPDLNGKVASVVAYAADRERYQVRMRDGGEELYLREVNLNAASGATEPPPAAAHEAHHVAAGQPRDPFAHAGERLRDAARLGERA